MDDSFGRKGPENALIPAGPSQPSGPEGNLYPTLLALGFFDERSHLRKESDEEFTRAAGSISARMDQDLFETTVTNAWEIDRRTARACFFAGDADKSARINAHEYLLLREAFVHEEPLASHEAVVSLRLRGIWFSYDVDQDEQLSKAELLEWMRELCTAETHVARVAAHLFAGDWLTDALDGDAPSVTPALELNAGSPPALTTQASAAGSRLTLQQFLRLGAGGKLEEKLAEHNLSTDDLIQNLLKPSSAVDTYRRVVYDGRAETAKLPTGAAGAAQTGGGAPATRAVAARGVGLPDGVSTAGVPGYAVNDSLSLSASLRAEGGWRGPLAVQRADPAFGIAARVIETAMDLAMRTRVERDVQGADWMAGGAALRLLLGEAEELGQADAAVALAAACKKVVAAQPMVVHVPAPSKIFGDIHGQLRDLLCFFGWYGAPTHKGGDIQTTTYVFNGDWVDRGPHQLEVVLVLFALKVMYPLHIFLVRGNHEFRDMNENMREAGFLEAVKRRLPAMWHRTYEACHAAFDWLPLAALVAGRVLVVHGGVGDASWGVRELQRVARPLADAHRELCTLHALWSDPSDSDSAMRSGVHESGRGEAIPEFGPDVTQSFCEANGLALVIRSHQFVRQGYKVMHHGRLVTLFSARNYFRGSDGLTNDAAMLLLAPDLKGHLRLHPKRLAHLADAPAGRAAEPAWRAKLLDAMVCCLQQG